MDKDVPLLPISIATQMTQLTPRKIRYYEQKGLIQPTRTEGKQRLFSLNQIAELVRLKKLIEKGMNISDIRGVPNNFPKKEKYELSEDELRETLKRELLHPRRSGLAHLTHGELSRFFF